MVANVMFPLHTLRERGCLFLFLKEQQVCRIRPSLMTSLNLNHPPIDLVSNTAPWGSGLSVRIWGWRDTVCP